VTGALGNGSAVQGTADVAVRAGGASITAGWRRATEDGALPNEFFAVTNLSGGVEVPFGDGSRAGVVLRSDQSTTGIPFSNGAPTPSRKTTADTTTLALPVVVAFDPKTTLENVASGLAGPADVLRPRRPLGLHLLRNQRAARGRPRRLTHDFGTQRLTFGSDVEWTRVKNADSYGVSLDEASTRTWSFFVEDRIAFAASASS